MKDFFAHRTVRRIIPLAFVICLLLAGFGSASAKQTARVVVGFLTNPPTDPITGKPLFQNVLLNIVSVRINPSASAGPSSGKWQRIPLPPGLGGSSTQDSELQIDLNNSQDVPQIFNTANVRPDHYKIAEIKLDQTNPGTLIPNCPLANPLGATADGCISYPVQLVNSDDLTFSAPGLLNVTKGGAVSPLILQLSMKINQFPVTPGSPYIVTVSLTQPPQQNLGVVTGTLNIMGGGTGSGTSPTGKLRKLTITAETIGANTEVSSAEVKNDSVGTHSFTLQLPAAGANVGSDSSAQYGSLYDLAVSGGASTFAATRLPALFPGGQITLPADLDVTASQTIGNITGQIGDGCIASLAVASATLQLLKDPNATKPCPNASTPLASCLCFVNPDQCVSVASATTDPSGEFPMPGTLSTPAAFDNIPTLGKNDSYTMEISAPGYSSEILAVRPSSGNNNKGGGTCSSDGVTFSPCKLNLTTGYLQGFIPIIPPNPGLTTSVNVFAEDHDTNNVESVTSKPIIVMHSIRTNSLGFGLVNYSVNVPVTIPGQPFSYPGFDLFAATNDLYQGSTDLYPGHSIVAIGCGAGTACGGAVEVPAACATAVVPTPTDPTQVIQCVGHGSILGQEKNADLGTSEVLEKLDPSRPLDDDEVQITNALVENQTTSTPSNNYAFCAPADTYQVQKFELEPPASSNPSAAPSPSPAAEPIPVTILPPPLFNTPVPTLTPTAVPTGMTPTATATAKIKVNCPTNCTNPDGSCPAICNSVFVPTPTATPSPTATP